MSLIQAWFLFIPGGGGGGGEYTVAIMRYCAARVTVLGLSFRPSVCLPVCLSVSLSFSATTRNKASKKRYQQVQCHTGLILKMAIFVKVLRSKDTA